ncbi:FkbM family methyltransferase [Ferruginibacter sp.]
MKKIAVKIYYFLFDLITLKRGTTIFINGFKMRMPVRYYKYYEDGYEKDNFEFYKSQIKENDTVIDIGGHIGLNAVLFAQLASKGKVYVFEPAPNTFKIIHETIKINNLQDRIIVNQQAVSSSKGQTSFYMADSEFADNANSLVHHRLDKKLKKIDVVQTSIDDFITDNDITKVDFIKIDVEGAELDALKGAVNCLKNHKPKMTLGLHPTPIKQKGDSLEEIYDLLWDCKYVIKLDHKILDRKAFCTYTDLFDVQLT